MKLKLNFVFLFTFLFCFSFYSQNLYRCYKEDEKGKIMISAIIENRSESIKGVYYKGQKYYIPLKFIKRYYGNEDGSYPVIYEDYKEINQGKVTGVYTFIKSGIWYYLTYKRNKDGKLFNFTITDFSLKNGLAAEGCM